MREPRKLFVAGVVLGAIAFAPAFYEWSKLGWGDWGWFHHQWEVGRIAILRWHEWPLWDPYHCGGVSLWGQPQSQLNAPTWWITGLAFGTRVGHKLFIVLHCAVGFAGMALVGRRLYRLAPPAAALAAVGWALGGFFAWRGAGGHSTFLAFHYLPWIYLAWRRTHEDPRYAGAVAALMGLTLLEGGTYPFPLIFLLLLFDFVQALLPPRVEWRVLRTGLLTGVLSLLVGAMRLWPVYVTMSRFPRETRMEDRQTLRDVLESLTGREPHDWSWGHRWVWAEYGAYVGYALLGLAALGAAVALLRRRARQWHLLGGALVFTACAMGNVGPGWPWPLLHELPVFENLHVPSRFHVLLTFYLALLAGVAVDAAYRALGRRTRRRLGLRAVAAAAWLVFLGVGADVVSNTVRIAARWDGMPIVGAAEPHFHLVPGVGYLQQYMSYPERNVGTAACYDPVPWVVSPGLWVGDRPQVRLRPARAGEVLSDSRTDHTAAVEVELREPARLIFNQNWDPDWTLSEGTPVEDGGRLAVDLPAGHHRLEARYAPADLPWSPLLTLLGLLLGLLGWWRLRPALEGPERAG